MPEASVFDATGARGTSAVLRDDVFGVTPNVPLMHQAVQRQLANARQGTHDTKTRGEVAGSTKKMWRQKGTGRARQGGKRAPHWRTGGVVFGPHPRSYHQDFPKKMRSGAIRSALSAKLLAGEVVLIEGFPALEAPNTKAVRNLLDSVALATSRLVVLDGPNDVVRLSARNLPKVRVVTTENISVYDILRHQRVVMVVGAARQLEQRYGLPMDDGHDHDHDHGHSHDEEAE